MDKKKRTKTLIIALLVCLVLIAAIILIGSPGPKGETIGEAMKDAVLHEENRINLFGLINVNPALISAFVLTGILLIIAALIRILVIPKFTIVPGKFQVLLEEWVGLFKGMAEENSPHKNRFLGLYLFVAGSYIFISTTFELFGIQVSSVAGNSMALPAPLSDINGAIAMGCMSYSVILFGGLFGNGLKGFGGAIKEFSLPISMSFRLFGALLSGLLVTELVYYVIALSFVLPVIVGIMFTLLHALIQAYVLTMLTAMFYGEVNEPSEKKEKKHKEKKTEAAA